MKTNLLAITILCFTTFAGAQTNYPGGISNCIARYSFANMTGTVSDVSGNSNNGTAYNVATTAGWRGAANSAAKFDGMSSYIQVPDAAMLQTQQLTMVALVRFDGYYSGNCQISMILSKGYPGYYAGVYGMAIGDNAFDGSCSIFTPTQQTRADFLGTNPLSNAPGTSPIQLGRWYFMAVTADGTNYASYLTVMDSNSMLTSISPLFSVPYSSPISTNSQDLTIGKHGDSGYPYWTNGAMDEVALFNRALSASEVYKIYYFLYNGYALGIANPEKGTDTIVNSIQNGQLYLKTKDGSNIGDVALYNLQGQKVAAKSFTGNSGSLDLSDLPRAIYCLKVSAQGSQYTLKVSNL